MGRLGALGVPSPGCLVTFAPLRVSCSDPSRCYCKINFSDVLSIGGSRAGSAGSAPIRAALQVGSRACTHPGMGHSWAALPVPVWETVMCVLV